jgi:hypothetical protein
MDNHLGFYKTNSNPLLSSSFSLSLSNNKNNNVRNNSQKQPTKWSASLSLPLLLLLSAVFLLLTFQKFASVFTGMVPTAVLL